jgi:hypothetical protein
MTDRVIVYPSAIPLDTDLLSTNRNMMIALGYLAQMALGTSTIADGLACVPTAPASLGVNVGQGSLLSLQTIDASAYGSLASDSDPLVKLGINAVGVTNFSTPAPSGAGNSVNYLIEAAFSETDGGSVVLPYYNASNPAQPYSGPGNAGTPNYTARQQRVTLTLKAGAPATTGTQATPAVDAGNVGLWVVTVANGQASVGSGNISQYPAAPFLPWKLPTLHPHLAHGQCRLSVVSATQIKLAPLNGSNIIIAGTQYQIPSGGIVLSAGLAASTLYYAYVFNSSGTLALELSTTGHATDTTAGNIGVEIKSGDNSRTLVGMIYTSSSGQFVVDTSLLKLCLNWFNRRSLPLQGANVTSSTASTTFVGVGTASTFGFLTWADEAVQFDVGGTVSNDTVGAATQTGVMIDGTQTGSQGGGSETAAGYAMCAGGHAATSLSDGHHSAQPGLIVTAGTGSCQIGISGFVRG